jgi:GNAT superfamily N-acetyltransferase
MLPRIAPERILHWTHDWEVRDHRRDDVAPGFVELYNSLYGRKIELEYCQWEFQGKDSPGRLVAGYVENKLVGVCGYNLLDFSGGTGFAGCLYIDMMVAPAHQRTGLAFSRLNLEVEKAAAGENAAVLYLFPNSKGAATWLANEDWASAGQMITQAAVSRRGRTNGLLGFQRLERFGKAEDEVAAKFEAKHPELVMVRRRSGYLNWRFAENPRYRYDQFRVTRQGEPFGYLVLKIFRDPVSGDSFGDIVDVLWALEDQAALREMLEFALGHFAEAGVGQSCVWLQTNTVLDEVGRETGFVETSQKRHLVCKVLKDEFRWVADARRWFITMADSEVY